MRNAARPPGSPRFSWTAVSIVLACAFLGVLLSIMTYRNLGREERRMERFLTEEGLTLIRTFEAAARSSMAMHQGGGGGDIHSLVRETAKAEGVAHIRIVDERGRLIASAGDWSAKQAGPGEQEILGTAGPVTGFVTDREGRSVFEVAKAFSPVEGGGDGPARRQWQAFCGLGGEPEPGAGRQVIYVGLYTRDFDTARREDVRHSLLMGAIIFVLGSAGFYFLFLYQGIRVSRATLENMELYTSNIIESMPSGLMTFDSSGEIVSCNRKTEELLGKRCSDLLGKPLDQVMPKEHCDLVELMRTGRKIIDLPVDCRRSDGTDLPLKVSAATLRNREGQPAGTVLVLRDMREIRAMEAQVERSRRLAALGRLAAGIAHEIRNPLGTLRGFAQLFARKFAKEEPEQEYAHLMIEEVDRLNRTISALLQFARPREPAFQEVDLGVLLGKVAKILAGDCRDRQVTMKLTPPDDNSPLWSDPDLLFQAVINLVKNSLEAMESGGTVHLGAGRSDGEVSLWVEDTGKGMTPEEQSRMFDPFFTTRTTGTGLGLANVHQIVTQLKGRIDVTSEVGRGTRIVMTFPARRPADGHA